MDITSLSFYFGPDYEHNSENWSTNRKVAEYFIHPSYVYNSDSVENDIALFKLTVYFSNNKFFFKYFIFINFIYFTRRRLNIAII